MTSAWTQSTPLITDCFEAFGYSWKRTASDYKFAISQLSTEGIRTIVRPVDIWNGDPPERQRAEGSGFAFAREAKGTHIMRVDIVPQVKDSFNWSCLLQLMTEEPHQVQMKLQHRKGQRLHLDWYSHSSGPNQLVPIHSEPAFETGQRFSTTIEVNFDGGMVRWFLNDSLVFCGLIPSFSPIERKVFPKYGGYREGLDEETTVTDFHNFLYTTSDTTDEE
jgi:hypothetical protein